MNKYALYQIIIPTQIDVVFFGTTIITTTIITLWGITFTYNPLF